MKGRHLAVLIVVVFIVLGGGRKFPSLSEQTILYLPESGCVPYTPPGGEEVLPVYSVAIDQGEGWAAIPWNDGILKPGDCLAFALLEEPQFKACCSVEFEFACSEEAMHDATRPHCERIFMLGSGRQYPQWQIDEWNTGSALAFGPASPPFSSRATSQALVQARRCSAPAT